jgi:hypothetical protein
VKGCKVMTTDLVTTMKVNTDGSRTPVFMLGDKPPPNIIRAWDFVNTFPAESEYESYNGGLIEIVDGLMRMHYPVDSIGGAVYNFLNVDLAGKTHVSIKFKIRMPSSYKHGFKIWKIFGQPDPQNAANYCNSTFGALYPTAVMESVAFGDGTGEENDQQHAFRYDGTLPDWAGRNHELPGAVVLTSGGPNFEFEDDEWHDFEYICKYNTGTTVGDEVSDGAFYVKIDGVMRLDATGVFNRHPSNLPMDSGHLGDWSQGATEPFVVEFTDVIVEDLS